ncbi:energy-coupling factor transporter transmembrane protein EcfT [Cellulomonas sp. URHE0023]|uniref:energy-coupling factor transporter transmembrane component T family protein n=1 Tax=Cellulomonas sp. URHE0023 TaxID=1380354 RepID=UPI0005522E45|nr:energy-coupling factor transporter transmembrane protein EcfT [Cellulomonas sp. URHE0023]
MSRGPLRSPWAGPLGLYHPGSSLLHRAPAGLKLTVLAGFAVAVTVVNGPRSAVVALGVAVLLQVASGVPWHRTTRGLVPTLAVAASIGAYQWWARGWEIAVEVSFDLVALVLVSTLLTATTRADALLDVLARLGRPLRHVGLSPDLFGLTVGLFLRTVPVLVRTTSETRDAARARGLERNPRAVLVPAAVRMVAHARATGDALAARGLGED